MKVAVKVDALTVVVMKPPDPGVQMAMYPVNGRPPSLSGVVQVTVAELLVTEPLIFNGALGTVVPNDGLAVVVAAAPVPTLLVAVTVTV